MTPGELLPKLLARFGEVPTLADEAPAMVEGYVHDIGHLLVLGWPMDDVDAFRGLQETVSDALEDHTYGQSLNEESLIIAAEEVLLKRYPGLFVILPGVIEELAKAFWIRHDRGPSEGLLRDIISNLSVTPQAAELADKIEAELAKVWKA